MLDSDDEDDNEDLVSVETPSLTSAHTGDDPGHITDEEIESWSEEEGLRFPRCQAAQL